MRSGNRESLSISRQVGILVIRRVPHVTERCADLIGRLLERGGWTTLRLSTLDPTGFARIRSVVEETGAGDLVGGAESDVRLD